jgi:hypothetical protein
LYCWAGQDFGGGAVVLVPEGSANCHAQITVPAKRAVDGRPRKVASDQELRHLAVTGSTHQAPSNFEPMLRRYSVDLRRVIVGHEKVTGKPGASIEQARMVHFPVSV